MNHDSMITRIEETTAAILAAGYDVGGDDGEQFCHWKWTRSDGSIVDMTYDGGAQFDVADYDDANAYQVEDARVTTLVDLDTDTPASLFVRVIEGE